MISKNVKIASKTDDDDLFGLSRFDPLKATEEELTRAITQNEGKQEGKKKVKSVRKKQAKKAIRE